MEEIVVYLEWPDDPPEEKSDYNNAVWAATANTPIPEFEFLAFHQSGVTVRSANQEIPSAETYMVMVKTSRGQWEEIMTANDTDLIPAGSVATAAGPMSWDEYMDMPDSDFGCG